MEASGKVATPRVGQQVRIEGRGEVFVVLRVDGAQHVADLLTLGKVHTVQAGVPLSSLRMASETQPESHPA